MCSMLLVSQLKNCNILSECVCEHVCVSVTMAKTSCGGSPYLVFAHKDFGQGMTSYLIFKSPLQI